MQSRAISRGDNSVYRTRRVRGSGTPWKEIGFAPTKIFGFKFADVVNAQKKEQIDAIVPFQEEVKALQVKYTVVAEI